VLARARADGRDDAQARLAVRRIEQRIERDALALGQALGEETIAAGEVLGRS
jgi:hypothetical protein